MAVQGGVITFKNLQNSGYDLIIDVSDRVFIPYNRMNFCVRESDS